MDVELDPAQPPEIERAVALLIEPGAAVVADPWWQAGIDEALSTYP